MSEKCKWGVWDLPIIDKNNLDYEYTEMCKFEALAQEALCTRDEIEEKVAVANEVLVVIEKTVSELDSVAAFITGLADPEKVSELEARYGRLDQIKARIDNLKKEARRWTDMRKDLMGLVSSDKNFSKAVCLSNIRELLKLDPKVKIGQIEKEAGIRLGYMSRLEKEGNTSDPSMEFVVTAAKLLGVSIDTLVSVNITELTPHERYILKFFDKLKADTNASKLDWGVEKATYLNGLEVDEPGEMVHPLFDIYPNLFSNNEPVAVFVSQTFEHNTRIKDDCYNLRLKNGTTLYLMSVEKSHRGSTEQDITAIEAWLYVPGKKSSILVSSQDTSSVSLAVLNLYETVRYQMKRPRIDRDAMYAIDAFMHDDLEDDKTDDGDDIPF